MKKFILFTVALFATVLSFAQVNPQAPLERDPAIKYGKLDNGMTYYIMHNGKPENRCEYYLLTNVGAIQETPAQNGLAHFLEHMCLNGTQNLPGKMMIDYFQSIGASFGGNINASTGVEQTQYMLNNIPTTRQGIIDTALLIMHDYSGFVTNDPEEIDKERGVIIEEWRTRRTADWRMFEEQMKYLYKGSKYESCNIIGTVDNLQNFPASELVDFYKTWYRPDMQAIVVVGDIDPDKILAQLQDLFKDIPAKENAKPKEEYRIPENNEPIVGIMTDPEAQSTNVLMVVKGDPMPREMKGTGTGLFVDLIENIIESIFSERFNDIAMKPNAPFLGAQAGFADITNTCEAMMVSVSAKDGNALNSFDSVLTEFEKAKRYGFTEAEFERAKTNMLSIYERAANNAESRKNGEMIKPISTDFFDGVPAMNPKYKYEMVKTFLNMLNVNQINQVLKSMDYDKDVVVCYQAPEKDGLVHPTEADFVNIINSVKTAEIANNIVDEVSEPLMDPSVLKGSPVKKEESGQFGSTVWTLKNGIKVVVRPSDLRKEEVNFRLSVDGGLSLLENEDLPSFENSVFQSYTQVSGVSKFPATKLSKMLAGKVASASPFIGELRNGVSGSCSPKDIETMFQLAYLLVCEPRAEEAEFAPVMEQIRAVIPNMEKQPNMKLGREFTKTLFSNNPRKFSISSEMLDKVSLATLIKDYKFLFSNMNGAIVTITGNVDLATLKPLVEKYIGSLPVARKENGYIDRNVDFAKGQVANVFDYEMSTPKTTCVMAFTGACNYSLENIYLMNSLKYIMDLVYTETIREDEGASYGVGTDGNVQNHPKEREVFVLQFDTDPARADKMIQLAVAGLEGIAKNGPTPEQFRKAQENFLKNIPESRINNSYWSNCLYEYYKDGFDSDTELENVINNLTAEKVQKFASNLLNQNNAVKVVMSPKEK